MTGRVCFHQSALGYRNGMVRCTDLCGQLFTDRCAWLEAIEQASRELIDAATVHGINDKGDVHHA